MRTNSTATWLLLAPLVLSTPQAFAEVFKCTTADGKTSYSSTPCTAPGAKEVVVPIVTGPMVTPAQNRDWAAESAAVNARVQAAEIAAAEARATAAAQMGSVPSKTAQQIAADCEANRGVDCSSAQETAKRRSDDTVPTEEEAKQRAAAGRRENERKAAEAAKAANDAVKPPSQNPPVKAGT